MTMKRRCSAKAAQLAQPFSRRPAMPRSSPFARVHAGVPLFRIRSEVKAELKIANSGDCSASLERSKPIFLFCKLLILRIKKMQPMGLSGKLSSGRLNASAATSNK